MAKVARAVQYAHEQGILHRDLKPGNILLDGRGEPLVSDFGLAKWLEPTGHLTRTPTVFGTPGYIAPEQVNGSAGNLTPAADVYSLGAVLFDLFTGQPPFIGEHALKTIQQATQKPAPKLRSLAPALDRDLEIICAKCLERDPKARYRSAGELTDDLERWLHGRSIVARPVSPPVHLWRWVRRNPLVAQMAALLLTMLSPLPDHYSFDHWVAKTKPKNPKALGFWRRVLQVHLCFVYFVGGLAKFLGSGWWDGSNLWRALIRPPFNLISPDLLVHFKYALPFLGVSICLLEISYPVFIWLKSTRRIWLVSILVMHAAIGLMMGLYLFALVMIVMNVSAFGVPSAIRRAPATSGTTEPS